MLATIRPSPLRIRKALPLSHVKELGTHKFGCLTARLPSWLSKLVTDWVIEQLHEEHLGPGGRELDPHLTVKYGFKDDGPETLEQLRAMLVRVGPFSARLGSTVDFFPEGKDGVPLKVDAECETLHELNESITASFDCETKFPVYVPHLTLGYVTAEQAPFYFGKAAPFLGMPFEIETVRWSTKAGEFTDIPLSFLPKLGFKRWYSVKGEGTCEPGQRADLTGCVPASGEGGGGKPQEGGGEENKTASRRRRVQELVGREGVKTGEEAIAVGAVVMEEIEERLTAARTKVDAADEELKKTAAAYYAVRPSPGEVVPGKEEEHARLSKELTVMVKRKADAQKKLNSVRTEGVLNVLREFTEMGGSGKFHGDPAAWAEAQNAMAYFPSTFVAKLSEKGVSVKIVKGERHGWCSSSGGGDVLISGSNSKTRQTIAVHEFGHAADFVMPRIGRVCADFFRKRTEGQKVEPMKKYKGSMNEKFVGIKDKFSDEYVGRIYDHGRPGLEVFTTGLEKLYFNQYGGMERDPEHVKLVIGILLGVR